MSRIMQKEIKSEMNDFFFAKDHLDFYHEYVNVEQKYLAGIKEVRTKLEILDDEFQHRFDHNPIHHMEWRLKSPHSVVEKMKRRNLPVEVSSIKGNIEDIAGIRVICHYIKDIYRMSDLLLRQDDIHLLKIKDYIKNPKENGYRSLHLVVEVPVYLANEKVMVPVEIQIRTIAMDFWATLEHHLRYKNDKEILDGPLSGMKEEETKYGVLDMNGKTLIPVVYDYSKSVDFDRIVMTDQKNNMEILFKYISC